MFDNDESRMYEGLEYDHETEGDYYDALEAEAEVRDYISAHGSIDIPF